MEPYHREMKFPSTEGVGTAVIHKKLMLRLIVILKNLLRAKFQVTPVGCRLTVSAYQVHVNQEIYCQTAAARKSKQSFLGSHRQNITPQPFDATE